ncbi:polysaccharide deacetylase [Paenibacillus sp. PK3_47]|uniref:polysaccharide deacetylase n=1 Tax=Paenibacillus sp. PK3_47 TaxID=2072642 RepID=UPI00201E52C4|nr:polysaccharide deacetylase [Paenibacillus sp. PK3_47]UQZ37542.1 polysaccharide deacetylase [Paenibacillus sp. PK3_47]
MKGSKSAGIRRIIIRGLLAMVIMILALTPWETRASSDTWKMSPPVQTGSMYPALYKNNLPAGITQDSSVQAGNRGRSAAADASDINSAAGVLIAAAGTKPAEAPDKKRKTVYLTFDDGPSAVTPKVLEILRQRGVKGTFFVLGEQAESRPELINAIWEQGHAIGNHTYNHNYQNLYSKFTEFWSQIKRTEEIVREITGERPQLVRAPGGTYGHFDETYFDLLQKAGYAVVDWNVDSGDSRRKGVPAAEILQASVEDTSSSQVVLLLHDGAGHEESAKALPEIIGRFKAAGYAFDVLQPDQKPVQFRVSAAAAGKNRTKPSASWISSNITPNAALFGSGKPLYVEVGRQEVKLAPGEYRVMNGQYLVPLRAVIERLGGQVGWDAASRSSRIVWNGLIITADADRKQLTLSQPAGGEKTAQSGVQLLGSSLWIPLRELLEATGHAPVEAKVTALERRVITS